MSRFRTIPADSYLKTYLRNAPKVPRWPALQERLAALKEADARVRGAVELTPELERYAEATRQAEPYVQGLVNAASWPALVSAVSMRKQVSQGWRPEDLQPAAASGGPKATWMRRLAWMLPLGSAVAVAGGTWFDVFSGWWGLLVVPAVTAFGDKLWSDAKHEAITWTWAQNSRHDNRYGSAWGIADALGLDVPQVTPDLVRLMIARHDAEHDWRHEQEEVRYDRMIEAHRHPRYRNRLENAVAAAEVAAGTTSYYSAAAEDNAALGDTPAWNAHYDDTHLFDDPIATDDTVYNTNGLPMVGGEGGIDVMGNTYGQDSFSHSGGFDHNNGF